MRKLSTLLALSSIALTVGSLAANAAPRWKERNQNQRQRIENGVKSGEINHHEAKRIARDERQVHRKEHELRQDRREARSDGVVTPQEHQELRQDRAAIERKQDKASKEIFRDKNIPDGKPAAPAEATPPAQ